MSGHGIALLFAFLFWTLMTVAVGVHAMNNGRSGFLWGVFTLFAGVFAVVIYLVVVLANADPTESSIERRVCPECSASHDGEPDYCSDCGESLGPEDDRATGTILRSGSDGYCSNCKSQVGLEADGCPDCGATF